MIKYTNIGLVNHAKMALGLNTAYMNSAILRPITTGYLNSTIARVEAAGCPAGSTGYTESRKKYLREKIADRGYYGVDCVCLVKSYYWSGKEDGGVGSPEYMGANDVNAGEMYRRAKVKGPISTMPEVPGLILYCKTHPHIGIYIGNGETIESTLGSRGDGVVKRKLDGFWEYWFECPYIEYPKAADTPEAPAEKTKKRVLAFSAVMREKPSVSAKKLLRLAAGASVTVYTGTEKAVKGSDGKTYTYIKAESGGITGYIVKSALK